MNDLVTALKESKVVVELEPPPEAKYWFAGAPELWILIGTFFAGGVANGMLGAISEDIYRLIKERLGRLAGRARQENSSVDIRIEIGEDTQVISIKINRIEEIESTEQMDTIIESASRLYSRIFKEVDRGAGLDALEVYAETSPNDDRWRGWKTAGSGGEKHRGEIDEAR